MRASIYRRSALLKLRLNLLIGREMLALSGAEIKSLFLHSPFETSGHVSPSAIQLRMTDAWGGDRRSLIKYDGIEKLSPINKHATSLFLRELILEGKTYDH